MITEDQMRTIFARANPVTDIAEADSPTVDGAAYLSTLEQRSSEVTQVKQEQTNTEQTPSRWRLVAIAAALVTVVGVAIVFMTSENQPDVADPVPTTISESAPSTTAPSEPTTTLSADEAWNRDHLPFTSVAGAGEYRTDGFEPAYLFTVPDGWQPVDGGDDLWVIGTQRDELPPVDVASARPNLGSVEETVEAIIRIGQPEERPDIIPIAIDGAEGLMFEFVPSEFAEGTLRLDLESGKVYPFDAQHREIVFVVDANGVTVVFFTNSFLPNEGGLSSRPEDLVEAASVIESIRWKDPVG